LQKDLQSDLDGMHLEVSRKEANISMLTNEKSRLNGELDAVEGMLLCYNISVFHEQKRIDNAICS